MGGGFKQKVEINFSRTRFENTDSAKNTDPLKNKVFTTFASAKKRSPLLLAPLALLSIVLHFNMALAESTLSRADYDELKATNNEFLKAAQDSAKASGDVVDIGVSANELSPSYPYTELTNNFNDQPITAATPNTSVSSTPSPSASSLPGYNPKDGTYCLNPTERPCQRTIPAAGTPAVVENNIGADGYRADQPAVLSGTGAANSGRGPANQGGGGATSNGSPSASSGPSTHGKQLATVPDTSDNYRVVYLYPEGQPAQYSFSKTEKAQADFDKAQEKYQNETCAMTTLDKVSASAALAGMGGALFGKGSDIGKAASAASAGAGLANAAAMAFGAGCEEEKAALEQQQKQLLETASKDYDACVVFGKGNATTACVQISGIFLTSPCVVAAKTENENRCRKLHVNATIAAETTWGYIKKHSLGLASTLAALGAGATGLLNSSEEVDKQNNTKGTTTKVDKCKDSKTAATDPSCIVAKTTTDKTDASSGDKTAANGTVQENQSCEGSLRPLECFVTPQCNLNCVASNFGVQNYGGKTNDATRIDTNGRVVGVASKGNNTTGNLGSLVAGTSSGTFNGSSLTGGSGNSGSVSNGVSEGNSLANNESATQNKNSEIAKLLASYSGFDVSGGFTNNYNGGSEAEESGGYALSPGRSPVNTSSGQGGVAKSGSFDGKTFEEAIISGPLGYPMGRSLFDKIILTTGRIKQQGQTLPY